MSERMNKERAKKVLEEELRLAKSQLDFLELANEFGIKPTEVQNKKQRVEKYAQALDYAIHRISAIDRVDKQVIEQLEHIKKIYDYELSEEQTQTLDIAIESLQHQVNEKDEIKLVCPKCKREWTKPIGEFCSSCGAEMVVEPYERKD